MGDDKEMRACVRIALSVLEKKIFQDVCLTQDDTENRN